MLFEVFIPARERDGFDETLTIEADNWMIALKSGLRRIGEDDMDLRSLMCDIKEDNSVYVTDAITRRVFILRELDARADETIALRKIREQSEERAARAAAAARAAEARAAASRREAASRGQRPAGGTREASLLTEGTIPIQNASLRSGPVKLTDENGRLRIGSSEYRAQSRDRDVGRIVREIRQKTGERPAIDLSREEPSYSISENILEDVFLESQAILESDMTMEDTVNFVMDMVMEKIPAESGAVMFVDVTGHFIYFAAARGPKAQEVMDFRIPMGQGLAGFCAFEGVTLSISDAPSDPRFFKQISDALRYPTASIACAPIEFEGRVYGCIELINRKNGTSFTSNEANALTYIGSQFAQYVNRLIMSREEL